MDYETWRMSFQSSEQAARAAFADSQRLAWELHQLRKDLAELVEPLNEEEEDD